MKENNELLAANSPFWPNMPDGYRRAI